MYNDENVYGDIDYQQRPTSYWTDDDLLAILLRNVKGRARRDMIRDYYEQGRLEELNETFLRETLSEAERDSLGKVHPIFMGGEYLPDYQKSEVEIARIELKSVTADVISIRARPAGRRIRYRVVDEYETEFVTPRENSLRPLTLRQLIRFIDFSSQDYFGVGLAWCYNNGNLLDLGDRARLRDFTRVISEFYPQLYEHYEHVYDAWVDEGEDPSEEEEEEEGETDPQRPGAAEGQPL